MRPAHLLRRAKSDRQPGQVVCVACEWKWRPTGHHVTAETAHLNRWAAAGFGGAAGEYGPDHWEEGDNADSWWRKFGQHLARRGATTVFCERADLVCSLLDLWGAVERGAINLGGCEERAPRVKGRNRAHTSRMRCVLESPPVIVEAREAGSGAKFKIVDVANYGPQPSAEGVSAADRCNRVAAFVRGMVAALKSRGLGSLKDTAATQAYFSFKKRHLNHVICVHNDERALSIEGDSYYGGRCEAFRLRRVAGPVYHLDVSAMYPFCAANYPVPAALAGVLAELGAGDQPQLGEGCGLIADVTVETDEPAYPYRDTANAVTVWPVGRFRTTLAGPELLDALAKDRVERWHRAAWYRMAPALRSYAECVLEMRREYADKPDLKCWAKALGVSLIGKFGQKDRRWVDAESSVLHGPWDSWWQSTGESQWNRYRSVQWHVQREEVGQWNYDAVPAIASWVCSAARMRLLQMIRCAGWGDTYYCDTDALMVSSAGYSRLLESGWVRDGEPGYLRIKNVSNEVEIHGIKAYDEEGRSVRLGQPLSVARAGAGEVRYWARRSAAGACRERRAPQAVRIAIRHDRGEAYKHGLVCADGSVSPFQLNEG